MSDPVPAITQVEVALAARLSGWPTLADWAIRVDGSRDIAIDLEDEGKTINVYAAAHSFDNDPGSGATVHDVTIELEVVAGITEVGTISQAAQVAFANIIAAIHSDRTLGGLIEDIQENDVAPSGATGKDVAASSMQCKLRFYTPRGDWFTIIQD